MANVTRPHWPVKENRRAHGRKVQRKGLYSGLHPDGQPWAEVLIGAEEIAGYLRLHPVTVRRMIREGRLPAIKDFRKRWMTTKSILEKWILLKIQEDREQRKQQQEEQRRWPPPGTKIMTGEEAAGLRPGPRNGETGEPREGAALDVCPHCKGWGMVRARMGTEPQPCPHCEGGYKRPSSSAVTHPDYAAQLEPERRG